MKYKRETVLRTGKTCLLRSLNAEDAQQALTVCRKTASQTQNLIRYEDEWTLTLEEEKAYIRRMELGPKSLLIGAFADELLVGIASFMPPVPADRVRHRATLGISILKAYWGRGIGTAMMQALIDAAKTTAIEQMELEVVSTNEHAIRLYKACGFEEFARHPRKLKNRDGTYADMILMMLDLTKKTSP